MVRNSLDQYDTRPIEMTNYLSHYGWHFNRKMCDFALSKMKKNNVKITPLTKEIIDSLLSKQNIQLENNELYDYIYVANYCKTYLYGSSIVNDIQMIRYIKDTIDCEDNYDGMIFNRWYADMCKKGIPISWDDLL